MTDSVVRPSSASQVDATETTALTSSVHAVAIAMPLPAPVVDMSKTAVKARSRSSSSSSSTSGSPLSYFEALLRRKSGSGTGSGAAVPTWSEQGYEILPPSARFCLTKLKVKGAHGTCCQHLGRTIPADVGFTLEWSGPFPAEKQFELKELSPALLQAGHFRIELLWMSDQGEFTNLAACKALEVRSHSGKKVMEKLLDGENTLSFTKPSAGVASLWVTVEGWMSRAKDRKKELLWRVSYTPLSADGPAYANLLSSSPDAQPVAPEPKHRGSIAARREHRSRSSSLSGLNDVKEVTAVPARHLSIKTGKTDDQPPAPEVAEREPAAEVGDQAGKEEAQKDVAPATLSPALKGSRQ